MRRSSASPRVERNHVTQTQHGAMLTHVRTTVVTRLQEVAHARDDVTECGAFALMYDDYGVQLCCQLTNVSVATEQEALKQ